MLDPTPHHPSVLCHHQIDCPTFFCPATHGNPMATTDILGPGVLKMAMEQLNEYDIYVYLYTL